MRESYKMDKLISKPLKYQHVYNEIHKLVMRSEVGEKLASERDLAKLFDCNMLTVRKSLLMLAEEGLVEKRPRSGTFILGHKTEEVVIPKQEFVCAMIHGGSGAYSYSLLEALAFEAGKYDLELKTVWYKDFDEDLRASLNKMSEEGCVDFIFPWIPSKQRDNFIQFIDGLDYNITTTIKHESHLDKYFDPEKRLVLENIIYIRAQIEYFLEVGYTKVAYVGPNDISSIVLKDRMASYSSVMGSLNLDSYIGLVDESVEQVDNLIDRWKGYAGELAIIAFDDSHALRILTSLHKHGFQIPKDFGVMGFNNTQHAQLSDPPLTTIAQDFDCHAKEMLRHATSKMSKDFEFTKSKSQIEFIIRESCGGKGKISENFLKKLPELGIKIQI